MSESRGRRFLVKAGAGFGVAGFGAAPGVNSEKLFDVAPGADLGLDAQPRAWHRVDFGDAPEANPWDAAHAIVRPEQPLFGAGAAEFVEPDLYQPIDRRPPAERESFAASGASCALDPQDNRLPRGQGFGWHLGSDHSELAQARGQAAAQRGAGVVIAHLDTGFDPDHRLKPAKLDLSRQRNFTGEGPLGDARDLTPQGGFTNRGHGPATLALLAGGATAGVRASDPPDGSELGGAPGATIVPVRVADSVVHFWTGAVAQGIAYAADIGADVLSLSMGGVASLAWAEAVNRAYEAGVVLVAAAGNNFAQLPTRNIVFPARFQRVIAATGIMANHRPYQNQPANIMQGNYGPASKMATALAAYTPNVPWAKLGCEDVAGMDGSGTSSATPQIAAAAALWIAANRQALANLPGWQKVEAVREALFLSAEQPIRSMRPEEIRQMLGRGALQANAALGFGVHPATLRRTPDDSATFAFLRLLTGLGISGQESQAAMMRLEMTQLAQSSRLIEEALDDPDADPESITDADRRRFMDAVIADSRTSRTLRRHLEGRASGRRPRRTSESASLAPPGQTASPPRRVERRLVAPPPEERRLRIFASDPSLSASMDTARLSEVTVSVPWEGVRRGEAELQPGPVGEYLEVVDVDPASGCGYAPVDLNDPYLLATDGLSPSESNPQFHQQMVYAVAMTTIRHFEHALGRTALWAPDRRRWTGKDTKDHYESRPVRRLRIYPHALREANAYYSPAKKALLFGYFPAAPNSQGSTVPGSTIFTCLSHDIIAHETTHALLDGLHRRYAEATNADMPAFHEAFADIVAIFQHFSLPGLLEQELQRTQGDLRKGDRLARLAQQFGEGIGRSHALRTFIGNDEPIDYRTVGEAHARGAILVSAVFAAFLAIYRSRAADLLRIAEDGASLLRPGAIHPDLLARFADEARKSATHVLRICIRALDYCPPVDLTFGDYLRALITADADLVPADRYGYRVAFLEAFRRRGIYPDDLRTVSVESLRWQAPSIPLEGLGEIIAQLDLGWDLEADRMRAAGLRDSNGAMFHDWLEKRLTPELAAQLGLRMGLHRGGTDNGHGRCKCERPDPAAPARTVFEVHSVRPARRVAPDGSFRTDLVIQLTQRRCECLGQDPPPGDAGVASAPGMWVRGGSTLLIDTRRGQEKVLYCISKRIDAPARLARQRDYLTRGGSSLRALYFGIDDTEPFAALHRGH